MCVWIIVESVFQCLGTDTFCPTSALSLIPGNILGDNTTDDTRKFSGNACVFTCLEMREYSSCLCFILWLCGLDSPKWSMVISNRSDMARIPVLGLYGILCRAGKHRQVHIFCFYMGHVHSDQRGHGWPLYTKIEGCVQLAKSSVSAQSYKRY